MGLKLWIHLNIQLRPPLLSERLSWTCSFQNAKISIFGTWCKFLFNQILNSKWQWDQKCDSPQLVEVCFLVDNKKFQNKSSWLISQVMNWSIDRLSNWLIDTLHVKPWTNGPASSRKWTQVELAYETCVGWPNRLTSFLASTHKLQKKKHFKADFPLFHWLIIG